MEFKGFINADCMEILPKIPDKYFDLAIVDPPYGLGTSVVNSGGRFKRYENKNGNWDLEIPPKEYFEQLFRVSKNQIIWGGNYFIEHLKSTRCYLIWDKKQPENISFASSEMAWTSFPTVAKTYYFSPMSQKYRFHPTQKPVALYTWILNNYAKKGDKILDTHVGSASSLIACEKLGFEYFGIEKDKEYFEKAKARLEEFKNQVSFFNMEGVNE